MNSSGSGLKIDEEALAAILEELEVIEQLLTALFAGETKSYHDSRAETYRTLLGRVRRIKKYLPDFFDKLPF